MEVDFEKTLAVTLPRSEESVPVGSGVVAAFSQEIQGGDLVGGGIRRTERFTVDRRLGYPSDS